MTSHRYEAHPLEHAGESDVTVQFTVSDELPTSERNRVFSEAEEEVLRRERLAGFVPITRVVFSAHEKSA